MRKIASFGFTKGRNKYTDAQVAALIDELGLVPAVLITPSLVRMYREEVRAACQEKSATKETVRMAVARCEDFLSSEEGKYVTEYYDNLFSSVHPVNR